MLDELLEVALAVRDEPDPEPVTPQLVEHRKGVLVEREVLVPLPFADHLGRARACGTRIAPHPEDDLLGERDPDLLVVDELVIVLQRLDRTSAGGAYRLDRASARAARRAAGSPRAPAPAPAEEGEVDVEENRLQHRIEDRSSADCSDFARAAGGGLLPAGRPVAVESNAAAREGGTRGKPSVSPAIQSGCPDLNWGPLRPERSALPGCATPRARKGYRLTGRRADPATPLRSARAPQYAQSVKDVLERREA